MASWELDLLQDCMLDTTTARPPTSCTSPTPPTARTPFVLSDDLSLSGTLTSTPPTGRPCAQSQVADRPH
eukprot:469272-Prorocentrum_minimum.AAC.1